VRGRLRITAPYRLTDKTPLLVLSNGLVVKKWLANANEMPE